MTISPADDIELCRIEYTQESLSENYRFIMAYIAEDFRRKWENSDKSEFREDVIVRKPIEYLKAPDIPYEIKITRAISSNISMVAMMRLKPINEKTAHIKDKTLVDGVLVDTMTIENPFFSCILLLTQTGHPKVAHSIRVILCYVAQQAMARLCTKPSFLTTKQ